MMRYRWLWMFLFLVGLPFFVRSVAAHHSFAAEFDANKPVVLDGVVTKLEWINPHIWLHIDVKGSDGVVVSWAIEGGSPNSLARRGLRQAGVTIGAEVKVDGFMAKSGEPVANGRNIVWKGGESFFMGSSGTGAPNEPSDSR